MPFEAFEARLRWCSGGLDGSALARKSMDNVSATMLPGGRIVTLTEIPYVPGRRTTRVSDPCADHYAVEVRAPAGPAGAWSTLFGTGARKEALRLRCRMTAPCS